MSEAKLDSTEEKLRRGLERILDQHLVFYCSGQKADDAQAFARMVHGIASEALSNDKKTRS